MQMRTAGLPKICVTNMLNNENFVEYNMLGNGYDRQSYFHFFMIIHKGLAASDSKDILHKNWKLCYNMTNIVNGGDVT